MDISSQNPYHFDSEKVDRLVELAVDEVLRNKELFLRYQEKPDIWLADDLPEILKKINQTNELVPPENLEIDERLTLIWARDTFRDMIKERTKK